MKSKIKILAIKNSESGMDVFVEDGGVASSFNAEGEKLTTDYYQSRIEKPITSFENLWDDLAQGKMYWKDWHRSKQEADNTVMWDSIAWLCCFTKKKDFDVEVINGEDFTEAQLIQKINSILILEPENA